MCSLPWCIQVPQAPLTENLNRQQSVVTEEDIDAEIACGLDEALRLFGDDEDQQKVTPKIAAWCIMDN